MSLGILASHGGSNLQAIMDACDNGSLKANVAVVVSNNSGSLAMRRARKSGIPAYHLSSSTHSDDGDLDVAIKNILKKYSVDLIILAGYMKKIGPSVLRTFHNRVINSHPALLPKYGGKGMYGDRVHKAVVKAKSTETGISIHLVDEHYDHGPIISQKIIAVDSAEGVEFVKKKVQKHEHRFWVTTLNKIQKGEIDLDNAGH
ncbi:MAG TPA: phosphoribosylglycinamide formyltransferase [Dehalococcoidia bacterium]|nr:phosphoribosylglycinamide formyltransferase [Candidatus Neomarinimicrobiota bacterium]MBH36046.1 phosphoribosylglycinamide formyltransferase [Dehalococcoidia bacterium]HBF01354.1 phosphoribosylglycinamide formyltransferase [Dehalococcoidia bacterium]